MSSSDGDFDKLGFLKNQLPNDRLSFIVKFAGMCNKFA